MEPGGQIPNTSNNNKEPASRVSPQIRYLLLLLFGIPLLWLLWIGAYVLIPGPESAIHSIDERVEVIIPGRSSLKKISEILAEKGVIRDDARFVMLAYLMRVAGRLQAGEYELELGKRPSVVLAALAAGRVVLRPVTIPEGLDSRRVADILAAGGWVDRDRFIAFVKDPVMIREFDLQVSSLEGYLFPDTYYLSRGQQDEKDVIRMMMARSAKVFSEIMADSGQVTSLSLHQILTIASIVEKETAKADERPLVAGVLINRYKKGMRLQADPTVIYGLNNFTGNLTRQDLNTPTPYNTYLIDGLPPGPICNPGRAAIKAVVMPADVQYLYFVSMNDGSHYFSETFEEHNQAVRKYQKSGN